MTTPNPPVEHKNSIGFARTVDKIVLFLAKHWLLLAGLFWGFYVGLPLLAPVLMEAGWTGPAKLIYTVYRPACHQRPDRSYFFGGDQLVYTAEELARAGIDVGPFSRDIGNDDLGWKVAFCERDVAIYGSIFAAGMVFAVVRRWRGRWLLPFRYYLLFLVPMGIDGALQLFGVHESNWILRSVTGALFGMGSVLFAYPYLDEAFRDVVRGINLRLGGGSE